LCRSVALRRAVSAADFGCGVSAIAAGCGGKVHGRGFFLAG
jgi:hypothetical protein